METKADEPGNKGSETHASELLEWDRSDDRIHQEFCPIHCTRVIETEQEPDYDR